MSLYISVPYFTVSTCYLAYLVGKSDEKGRKRFKEDFLFISLPEKDKRILSSLARKREMAGGYKEVRPGLFDYIHLSREAKQELRAANGIVRPVLVDSTLLF